MRVVARAQGPIRCDEIFLVCGSSQQQKNEDDGVHKREACSNAAEGTWGIDGRLTRRDGFLCNVALVWCVYVCLGMASLFYDIFLLSRPRKRCFCSTSFLDYFFFSIPFLLVEGLRRIAENGRAFLSPQIPRICGCIFVPSQDFKLLSLPLFTHYLRRHGRLEQRGNSNIYLSAPSSSSPYSFSPKPCMQTHLTPLLSG